MELVSSVSLSMSDCSGIMSEDDSCIASSLSTSLFSYSSIVAAGAAGCLVTFFLFLCGLGIFFSISLPDVSAYPWPRVTSFAFLHSACRFSLLSLNLCFCATTQNKTYHIANLFLQLCKV